MAEAIDVLGKVTIYTGNVIDILPTLPAESVDCVVTSPPYFGLRDYKIEPTVWGGNPRCDHVFGEKMPGSNRGGSGTPTDKNGRGEGYGRNAEKGAFCRYCAAWRGQLGLEPTHQLFLDHIVTVFREVRRVLKKTGVVWLNMGDTYACAPNGRSASATKAAGNDDRTFRDKPFSTVTKSFRRDKAEVSPPSRLGRSSYKQHASSDHVDRHGGFKAKDRMLMPARLAIALQDDGWWVRDEIIFAKPNPMPSSVKDRTTPAHEMVYLLTKASRYFYDVQAIAEPIADSSIARYQQPTIDMQNGGAKQDADAGFTGQRIRSRRPNEIIKSLAKKGGEIDGRDTRNKRSVWTIPTQPFPEAHFATFPTALVEPMILAGCPKGGVVLDPFGGSGTVGLVAARLGRRGLLIDAKPDYVAMAERRIRADWAGPDERTRILSADKQETVGGLPLFTAPD